MPFRHVEGADEMYNLSTRRPPDAVSYLAMATGLLAVGAIAVGAIAIARSTR